MARRGRGRLSSIDLLPEAADEVVAWAFQELKERDRLQKDIHEEFNERLAAIGCGPISASAFNRHSLRLAAMARRHEETRQITAALTERMEPGQTDDLTIIAAETVKMLVFELLEAGGDITPKGAMELARALKDAVASQKVSVDRKREQMDRFEAQVDEALEKVQVEAGMTAARKSELRRDILGVRP
ncbi:MAG: DUF3486 family protein [Paracoccaceae bacterium]